MVSLSPSPEEKELVRIENELEIEFADFKQVLKSSSLLMKTIDVLLRVLTLNLNRTFLTGYTTTIGNTVYVPPDWLSRRPFLRAEVLRHERVHMRQRDRMGTFCYVFTYLFWMFPVVFAVGRRDLEQEAYTESLWAFADYYGPDSVSEPKLRETIISHFTGSDYFWPWPFRASIERWYDATVTDIQRFFAVTGAR